MEMHQVRYFLAVSRQLNFTRAADECHVAQPSLTRAIKKLEEELGGDLFRRERSLTHLTDLGRMMLPHLQHCYDSALAAKALARSLRSGKMAPLRLALSRTINLQLLTPVLNELIRALPGLSVKLFRGTASEVAASLKNGDSEIAVAGPLGEDWDRFDTWRLFEEAFVLVMNQAHPLAARNEVAPTDLVRETVFARPYCEQGAEVRELLEASGVASEVPSHQIDSENDLIVLLEANLGLAILPQSFGHSPSLRTVALRDVEIRRTVNLYAVSGRQRGAAASLLLKLLRFADWSGVPFGQPAVTVRPDAA